MLQLNYNIIRHYNEQQDNNCLHDVPVLLCTNSQFASKAELSNNNSDNTANQILQF